MTTEIRDGSFSKGALKKEALLDCCMDHLNGKKGKALQISHLVHHLLETLKVENEEVSLKITAKSMTYDGNTIKEGDEGWNSIVGDVHEILVRVGKVWDTCSPSHAAGAKSKSSSGEPGKHDVSGSGDTYNCDHCIHYHGSSGSHLTDSVSLGVGYAPGLKGPNAGPAGKSSAHIEDDEQIERLQKEAQEAKAQLAAYVEAVKSLTK